MNNSIKKEVVIINIPTNFTNRRFIFYKMLKMEDKEEYSEGDEKKVKKLSCPC